MRISRTKSFRKSYQKLAKKIQKKVDLALLIFQQNIFDPKLNNHSLKGKYESCRSINVTGDLRIIFQEKNGYIEILLLDIGSHSQLY